MAQEQEQALHTVDSVLSSEDGYDGFVRTLFNRCGTPAVDFTHAVLGITTECQELLTAKDSVNAVEELGDLTFYEHALLQVLMDHYGEDELVESCQQVELNVEELNALLPNMTVLPLHQLYPELSAALQDVAKRWIGYGRAPTMRPGSIVGLALATIAAAAALACGRGLMPEDLVQRTNVAKLLKRYNGVKFSADAAINRDTAAERQVLEDAQSPA